MKKRIIIAFILLVLLTTITSYQKLTISYFNIKKIIIKNNSLLDEKDIRGSLQPIYNKNLFLLKNSEIVDALTQYSFINSLKIRKQYPDTLNIKIFEKKPIAILINNKKKFYIGEKIDLIEFIDSKDFKELPYVFGNKDDFKIFYTNLKKIDFPFDLINKYILFESNRWDLETINEKIIKLPSQNYNKKLENFLNLKDKTNFQKYKIFDYRIENQLILK